MPTYEYACDACGHQFEQFQSIKAGALRKCPACGKLKLRRLISGGGGLIFKGSGFYITDYRSDNYKQAAKKETETTPSGKSEGKSDGKKGDAKKETAPKSDSKTSAAG
jgi:putative FmdB family regulatory protein